ncbi:hypothetical protein [Ruminococcus gauvreauii]|uniref:Uncharacterized protein n=1 Tax=Ruminococcus gauvreauii TaxID=438033 RepID=A0ABY5VFR3_9FIRM|nr:hypothetical protein [Ruminococcus gauvreauii]UWP59395.1 hypothetical protein NQ502_18885 [Ruminococcus gauvreauii]
MTQKQTPLTFEVRIEDCRNFTWQGKLTTEDRQIIEFRSELELLTAIEHMLCDDEKI